jgi:hypothetical protein
MSAFGGKADINRIHRAFNYEGFWSRSEAVTARMTAAPATARMSAKHSRHLACCRGSNSPSSSHRVLLASPRLARPFLQPTWRSRLRRQPLYLRLSLTVGPGPTLMPTSVGEILFLPQFQVNVSAKKDIIWGKLTVKFNRFAL